MYRRTRAGGAHQPSDVKHAIDDDDATHHFVDERCELGGQLLHKNHSPFQTHSASLVCDLFRLRLLLARRESLL